MKISESNITMNATRTYQKTVSVFSETRLFSNAATSEGKDKKRQTLSTPEAEVSLSAQTKEALRKRLQAIEAEKKKAERLNDGTLSGIGAAEEAADKFHFAVLKKMLELMKLLKEGKLPAVTELSSAKPVRTISSSLLPSLGSEAGAVKATGTPAVLTRQTVLSSFYSETEVTAYQTSGLVKTADGRELSFQLTMEMSRSFLEEHTTIREDTVSARYCDPLVINLDSPFAAVSDQKFLFDLDCDGTEDEISYLKEGSAFLAYDKNQDGQINDGSELFGASSGDGFAELSAYDEDHNGWIDENDSIFRDLKVWTKQKDGKDALVALGAAGVGAIYLENASTLFHLNSQETNAAQAQVKKTGLFLKETGEAGTIQHIDFAL